MEKYEPQKIERKWQEIWEREKIFRAQDFSKKPKFYILDMFPYPSGEGLHVGHPRGYISSDIIANFKRMRGLNVLHPMGWDAFGLPAENYAIKTGIHPEISTKKNVARFKEQMKMLGLSYDWQREINTTDPAYYKWTQWIFLLLFKRGLAYEAVLPINWCPSCKTGLANEEVSNGKCERCGAMVTKKNIRQWVLKITAYAEKLLQGLGGLDWPEEIKELQKNWIGRSEGATIKFKSQNSCLTGRQANLKTAPHQKLRFGTGQADQNAKFIEVFTTRPDTIFGATFLVLAPEHELAGEITTPEKKKEVEGYIEQARQKLDVERQLEAKEKTGVFTGSYAINPATGEQIPVWIADYILPSYGYGAIMAVPGHDQRDWEFAKKYNLPIKSVINPGRAGPNKIYDSIKEAFEKAPIDLDSEVQRLERIKAGEEVYSGEGFLMNSNQFDGLFSQKAREKIIKKLKSIGAGDFAINYKLRDWVFSRQRYWGEPIPLVFCEQCKEEIKSQKLKTKSNFSQGEILNPGWIALSGKNLPLKLPEIENYQPTGTGESPLVAIESWVNTKCPKCGGPAERETNTMPQWAGSCWYFLAYSTLGAKNLKILPALPTGQAGGRQGKTENYKRDKNEINYWNPVDFYIGGAEHAVLHLLYARFWIKVLADEGVIGFDEPFLKFRNVGLILAPDGQKMSKSRGNVINPDEIVAKYGADTLRIYEMFMGPFNQAISWDTKGIMGARRFLEKVYNLIQNSKFKNQNDNLKCKKDLKTSDNQQVRRKLHQTIKKVTEDIENMRFNTAIAAMMSHLNEMSNAKTQMSEMHLETFLKLLAPFAPHLAEELWQEFKGSISRKGQEARHRSIFQEQWPEYDSKLVEEAKITLVIQVNGKVRDQVEAVAGISEDEAKELVFRSAKIQKWLQNKEIRKTIFVKDKLINFVI